MFIINTIFLFSTKQFWRLQIDDVANSRTRNLALKCYFMHLHSVQLLIIEPIHILVLILYKKQLSVYEIEIT